MIINQEYISISTDTGHGELELEAWPFEGVVGAVTFQLRNSRGHVPALLAVRHYNESWSAFWGRIDPQWHFTQYMQELAEMLEKEWTGAVRSDTVNAT